MPNDSSEADLLDWVYSGMEQQASNLAAPLSNGNADQRRDADAYFCHRAILTPLNVDVENLKQHLLELNFQKQDIFFQENSLDFLLKSQSDLMNHFLLTQRLFYFLAPIFYRHFLEIQTSKLI